MLIKIATATPPYKAKQNDISEELKKRMAAGRATARMIDVASYHSGIEERYFVIPDAEKTDEKKFYSGADGYIIPGTKQRMDEYEKWSVRLAGEAVCRLQDETGFDPAIIDRLITISCTGFFAPGVDYCLMEELKIPASVKRTNIGFMGCAASVTGLNTVMEALNSGNSGNVLMVSVELCSLHLQPEPTRDNILANMIFADGAAAAYFSNKPEGKPRLKITDTASVLFPGTAQYMGWKVGDAGFEMMLSSELPAIILNSAAPKLLQILSEKGINPADVKYWALHPGGRAILDSLQAGLMLTDEQMLSSRKVLKNYGNMSSASILFVMKDILDNNMINKGDVCCAVAFGPGLTMEVALLQGE